MRKFLLWIGTMWVGMATLIVVVSTLISADTSNSSYNYDNSSSSGAGAFVTGVIVWLFALLFGLALSAPAFLNPPEDNGGIWAFRLPLPLWMFLMLMKLTSWVGFYILLGAWMLIFKVWTNHQNNRLPSFSNSPQQAQPAYGQQPQPFYGQQPQPMYGQQPQQQRPASAMPPASWQADPTGRYPHRWWDGSRWTDRVTNGNFQAVDPL